MIFAATWEKVLDGSKTRTTRRAYSFEGEVVPSRYVVGRTYAVQKGRGGRGIARVEILSVDLLPNLRGVDAQYVREEGFESVENFHAAFLRVNGSGLDEPVYSIRFRLTEKL